MPMALVTGGGGFVGYHVVEFLSREGYEVTAMDNLSRPKMLKSPLDDPRAATYNWESLKGLRNVRRHVGDITDPIVTEGLVASADLIVHAAAQVAVTTSLEDPRTDFDVNAQGTFNILEAARRSREDPTIIFCSTNKVYGENINRIPVKEMATRYVFDDPSFEDGIPTDYPIDNCGHSPYGASKLAADIYVQDYARSYGLKTGVFRMSCVYGPRQFGTEDQGWLAHFAISTLLKRPITIYGDGKQVRDVLHVRDLVGAFHPFAEKSRDLKGHVYNIGGGHGNTLSLLELLDLIERLTGKRTEVKHDAWRPSDQKVYISDIGKAARELGWKPEVSPEQGVKEFIDWFVEWHSTAGASRDEKMSGKFQAFVD